MCAKKNAPATTIKEGVDFYLKYLGKQPTDKVHGPGSTASAYEMIRQIAKTKKLMLKVKMSISIKEIRVIDYQTDTIVFEAPLYRVSYCTVEAENNKICSFVIRISGSRDLLVHSFYCGKKSKAEAVTVTVAEAFNVAYADWQAKKLATAADKQSNTNTTTTTTQATVPTPTIFPITTDIQQVNEEAPPPLYTEIEKQKNDIKPILETNPFLSDVVEKQISPSTAVDNGETDLLIQLGDTPTQSTNLCSPSANKENDIFFSNNFPSHHPVNLQPLRPDDCWGEMRMSDFSPDVLAFLNGERSAEDLAKARSMEDLLDI